jgi:hypothetical protein
VQAAEVRGAGAVAASFPAGEAPPIDDLKAWIDERDRAHAPKRLSAQLDGVLTPAATTPRTAAAARRSSRAPRRR